MGQVIKDKYDFFYCLLNYTFDLDGANKQRLQSVVNIFNQKKLNILREEIQN